MTTDRAPGAPALRALNRFGLGARIGEAGRLGDPVAWLERQLEGDAALAPGVDVPTRDAIGGAFAAYGAAARDRDRDTRQAARRGLRRIAERELGAALTQRVRTDRPFVERLVAFWSNHLCVSAAGKPLVAPLAGLYEREAIRPHVLGRFEDMVLASAKHPAMLLYLDNVRSIGPGSPVGRRTARRGAGRGLNENYARELLELHTLGVDGGYTQEDVLELARALTGWTVRGAGIPRPGRAPAPPDDAPSFAFEPDLHEPGPRAILGRRYDRGGADDGEAAIRDLCRAPATARFVAGKLVRHFVADDPPPAAAEAMASVFLETSGDLRAVARALVRLDAAWDPAHRKLRSPQDWLVALARAAGARELPAALAGPLRQLRHPLWAPPSPQGFGDLRGDWADPDALMNRAELARTLARRMAGDADDPRRLLDVMEIEDRSPLPALLADESIPADERVALAVAGPAFQWR